MDIQWLVDTRLSLEGEGESPTSLLTSHILVVGGFFEAITSLCPSFPFFAIPFLSFNHLHCQVSNKQYLS